MDKIRLKIAIILATIFFTGNAFSQTTMKELIGLPIDSIGFNITMDSTDNRNIPTTSRSLQVITRISGNELHIWQWVIRMGMEYSWGICYIQRKYVHVL